MKISTLQRMIAINRGVIHAQEQKIKEHKNVISHIYRGNEEPRASEARKNFVFWNSHVRKGKKRLAKLVAAQKDLIAELKAQYNKQSAEQTIAEFDREWNKSSWFGWSSIKKTIFYKE